MGSEQSSSAKLYTQNAKNAWTKFDIVPISIEGGKEVQRVVHALYDKKETLRDVVRAIKEAFHPLSIEVWRIKPGSFTGSSDRPEENSAFLNASITRYSKKQIMQQGLKVEVRTLHRHEVNCRAPITCPEMAKGKTCPIYAAMKQKYVYTEEYYQHLINFTHFGDVGDKELCRHRDECKTFKRMENGGNKLADRCHFKLYRHPPRAKTLTLSENIHPFVMNTARQDNHDLYEPTYEDYEKYKYNEKDGFLMALVEEVVRNGFKSDLCTKCGPKEKEKCQHDYSLLTAVNAALKHPRHAKVGSPLRRDEMLALVMYTGCDCNYDMCRIQRQYGNYQKWKWFDRCLWDAIAQLSSREKGAFSVYSGVSKVKMPQKSVKEGYFATYVSTSWSKDVAQGFLNGEEGMIIQLDEQFKDKHDVHCCDVSWISKFGENECEVLFARSLDWNKAFEYEVIDEADGVQTVMVKLSTK